jgi:hypothetical protein
MGQDRTALILASLPRHPAPPAPSSRAVRLRGRPSMLVNAHPPIPLPRTHCPSCRGRLPASPYGAPPFCRCCGGSLAGRRRHRAQATALLITAMAVLAAAVPDLLQGAASYAVRSSLIRLPALERFESMPDPARQPLALLRSDLLERLADADRQWEPSVEVLADGSTRYHYRRRPGDPRLSLEELRQRIASPPDYAEERRSMIRLLRTLQAAGVQLEITQPRKRGAAAEWEARRRTLRIDPGVADRGSLDFARVLNHEAIHVAQSCRAGGLRAAPMPLGLPRTLSPHQAAELEGPTYAGASALERVLEAEAYGAQDQLDLGDRLLRRHCRLHSGATPG